MAASGDVYQVDDAVRSAVARRLSVIAVNYGGAALCERLAGLVWAAAAPPLEFIVVDNASPGDDAARLRDRHDLRLVASPQNLGFGQGCMLGARHARGDLLLFLNPDLEPTPTMFGALVGNYLQSDSVAVAFPKMTEPGVDFTFERKLEDVASMAGAAMLTSREHLEAVGGFDARIFLYYEETDLCWRTRLRGRRVVQDWQALAIHEPHGSGGGDRWAAEQIKNGLLVHLRLRAWGAVARFTGWMLLKTLVRGVRYRDPAVVAAWAITARRLPGLLRERRRLLGTAPPLARAELEVLCRNGEWWAWWYRRQALRRRLSGLIRRVGR
jgi:N-acetylglucosaminyl-diphospho-decaprenol L-rhamnosyltransferase